MPIDQKISELDPLAVLDGTELVPVVKDGVNYQVPSDLLRNGNDGSDGKSAYQLAVDAGFAGTEAEWLASLNGTDGSDGTDGDSAYQIAVNNGFVGTEAEWLASLAGSVEINDQVASYTLALIDAGQYVRLNVADANTLTVPANADVAFAIGSVVQLRQVGAGQTTVIAGTGVTINTAETLKLRKQGSSASLVKVAADEWDLTGDLEIAP